MLLRDRINDINKKISIRNNIRNEFTQRDNELSSIYKLKMQRLKKKAINYLYYFIYCIVALIIIFLYIYKKIDQKVYYISYICLSLLSFIPLIIYFIKLKKLKVITKEYEMHKEKNNEKKDISIKLNLEIATLSVGVICLSENYYELSSINDENKLINRWNELISEYVDGINQFYNNDATIEEYINFYEKWLISK